MLQPVSPVTALLGHGQTSGGGSGSTPHSTDSILILQPLNMLLIVGLLYHKEYRFVFDDSAAGVTNQTNCCPIKRM